MSYGGYQTYSRSSSDRPRNRYDSYENGASRSGGYMPSSTHYQHLQHPSYSSSYSRRDLYKDNASGGYYSNQEQRRRFLLEEQRNRRGESYARNRDFGESKPKKKVKGAPSKPREYKDILSYSEYLVERPDDLEQWIVVACPKGKRCTLVAEKGRTSMYDKAGRLLEAFESHLPGGLNPIHVDPNQGASRKSILDCVFNEHTRTFYVLDLIMWNLHPFVECETSLRFFWLESHFLEVAVSTKSRSNNYPIVPAKRFPVLELQQYLSQPHVYPDNEPRTDGFLFYHPEAIYMSGTTPLVGWLKGYMIPEVIGEDKLSVHSNYVDQKPSDFTTLQKYVEQHGNFYGTKKKKSKEDKTTDKMDTE